MSRTLHAFKKYSVDGENEWCREIVYVDDKDYDFADGNWSYIYRVLGYGGFILNIDVCLPTYDYLSDADWVNQHGMDLISPNIVAEILEAAIESINNLCEGENPIVKSGWTLFKTDNGISFNEQKEQLLYYADKLLKWAKAGLYFVEERE